MGGGVLERVGGDVGGLRAVGGRGGPPLFAANPPGSGEAAGEGEDEEAPGQEEGSGGEEGDGVVPGGVPQPT